MKEEVAAAKADKDKELPDGIQIIQTAIGDQNIQITGDGNIANVNTPKTKR